MNTPKETAQANRRLITLALAEHERRRRQQLHHDAVSAEVEAAARRHGLGGTEVAAFAQAAANGSAEDPEAFFARIASQRALARDYPAFAAEMAAVPVVDRVSLPGLTRGDGPLPLDPFGRTTFSVWEQRHGGSLRARGVRVEGPLGMGANAKARLSCQSCGGEWHIPLTAPLSSASITCPGGCNRASTTW